MYICGLKASLDLLHCVYICRHKARLGHCAHMSSQGELRVMTLHTSCHKAGLGLWHCAYKLSLGNKIRALMSKPKVTGVHAACWLYIYRLSISCIGTVNSR